MESILEQFDDLKHFNLEEIKSMTGNFDDNKVIGEGGFGKVYSGVLFDSEGEITVALKRLSKNSWQGNSEYLKEIFMLSRYTHYNLISLVGFCDEDDEKILVYEHASHGSLDSHLSSMTLTWTQRLKICLGAARGLSYLHDPKGTHQRVIHRDIKSSNILLDDNWDAKVSDMGLSKLGPANQSQTFLATNVAGTLLYIDPMYIETNILTKESDVYSFGLVLFEVMCGSLCYKQKNNKIQSLVRRWKKSYKEKKLEDIIFHNLKQDMDTRSMETFSEIAYQCLQRSRAQRPKMSYVVEKLELALQFQQGVSNPEEFKEILKSVVNEDELEMLLYKGIVINGGNTWFSLNMNWEHCEMISAECFIPTSTQQPDGYVPYDDEIKSRFEVHNRRDLYVKFNAHIKTQFLSPNITYKVNLVFMNEPQRMEMDPLGIKYKSSGETNYSILFIANEREDEWLVAELYEFINDETSNVDLEIEFDCAYGIEVEGIEFLPLEEENEDEDDDEDEDEDEDADVDLQTDRHWERKLPSDYKSITLWAEESLQRSTNTQEIYSSFCKGFQIRDFEQWISLAKNGKICHMLSPRQALQGPACPWAWQSSPESRLREVAIDPVHEFWVYCSSDYLSPETTYGTFLVYKLQENHSWFEHPVLCRRIAHFYNLWDSLSWVVYLLSPEAPAIPGKFHQKKGFPQERDDGWMEVRLYEFETNIEGNRIEFNLNLFDFESLKGLIVQGIEFKPI